MKTRLFAVKGLFAVGLLAMAGFAVVAPPARAAAIVIKTFQFVPSPSTVSVGTITVRNDDNTTHTFTSNEAGLFNVVLQGPNTSKSVTIPKGSHKYHCAIHTSMTGEITVT